MIFKAKLNLESGNQKIQYGRQAAILKVTLGFAYGHHQHANEIWNWNSMANLTYTLETMLSIDRPMDGQTDSQTDGPTRWIQYTPLQLGWVGV